MHDSQTLFLPFETKFAGPICFEVLGHLHTAANLSTLLKTLCQQIYLPVFQAATYLIFSKCHGRITSGKKKKVFKKPNKKPTPKK